jgi:hypothetical protein
MRPRCAQHACGKRAAAAPQCDPSAAAGASATPLTAYEKEREDNIKRNRQRLDALGIGKVRMHACRRILLCCCKATTPARPRCVAPSREAWAAPAARDARARDPAVLACGCLQTRARACLSTVADAPVFAVPPPMLRAPHVQLCASVTKARASAAASRRVIKKRAVTKKRPPPRITRAAAAALRPKGSAAPPLVALPDSSEHDDEAAAANVPEQHRLCELLQLRTAEVPWEYGCEGPRVLCEIHGRLCHQCRQKSLGLRTACACCSRAFCGDCLAVRYGESLLEVQADPTWVCPFCRGICNCSALGCTRAKARWGSTYSLASVTRRAGMPSAAHYLITQRQRGGPVAWPLTPAVRAAAEADAEAWRQEQAAAAAAEADEEADDDEEEEEKEEEEEEEEEVVVTPLAARSSTPPPAAAADARRSSASTPPASPRTPDSLVAIGTRLRKRFYVRGRWRWYGGSVVSYDKRMRWYLIVYDDGDAEHRSASELRELLHNMSKEKASTEVAQEQEGRKQGTLALRACKPRGAAAASVKARA